MQLLTRIGSRSAWLKADISKVNDIKCLMESVRRDYGHIDVLFANAGTSHCPPLRETDEASFDALVDLNLKGMFFTCVYALPLLAPGASIILTASAAAEMGRLGDPLYAASKAAVRSLARGFGNDPDILANKIRVNAISPRSSQDAAYSHRVPATRRRCVRQCCTANGALG